MTFRQLKEMIDDFYAQSLNPTTLIYGSTWGIASWATTKWRATTWKRALYWSLSLPIH